MNYRSKITEVKKMLGMGRIPLVSGVLTVFILQNELTSIVGYRKEDSLAFVINNYKNQIIL